MADPNRSTNTLPAHTQIHTGIVPPRTTPQKKPSIWFSLACLHLSPRSHSRCKRTTTVRSKSLSNEPFHVRPADPVEYLCRSLPTVLSDMDHYVNNDAQQDENAILATIPRIMPPSSGTHGENHQRNDMAMQGVQGESSQLKQIADAYGLVLIQQMGLGSLITPSWSRHEVPLLTSSTLRPWLWRRTTATFPSIAHTTDIHWSSHQAPARHQRNT